MNDASDFSEQSAQHEAAHAVIAYRHGIDVLFGITLDPQMIRCWYNSNWLDLGAFYMGRVPHRGMIVGMKKEDPDRARVMAEGVVCSALAAGCLLKHLKCEGHLGTDDDEAQALNAARAVLPESEAKRWVEDLREQTRKEVAEPRNLAVLGAIVRALREAERCTLGPEALRGILRNA